MSVRRWVFAPGLVLLAPLALLTACASEAPTRVDPARYDAFFLWAGVRPPPALERARTIYILDGEVRAGDNTRIVPLRPQVPRVRHAEVWLTLRTERLDWAEPVYRQMLADAAKWEDAGTRLAGVQIDFDAHTRGLDRYAAFLADLRRRLPARYRLSVTGLMDWSANGDAAQLARLRGVIDEVVIQTYQGRRTIPGYEHYLASLIRLPIPYRVGLVEGGDWKAPAGLESDPEFRGYVVFLVN
ncbi:MAG: DUF3142 domain-containing protein [Novosphingobium sp.]